MTIFKISKGKLPESVILPRSKSHANRALVLASVSSWPCTIENLPQSTDVTNLMSALKQIGLDIHDGDVVTVKGHFPEHEKTSGAEIEVGEGGTTARFLACLLVRGSAPYALKLGTRLRQRPWEEFINVVKNYGGHAELKDGVLHIQGPLRITDSIEVDCHRTTQYASGFQLAYSDSDIRVIPRGMSSSLSYWEMTKVMLESFKKHKSYHVPIDWSSASYPMAFAALNHAIVFPGLEVDPTQADSKMYVLLEALGAISKDSDSIKVIPFSRPHDVTIDVSDCLDLFPTLCFLLSHIPGQHRLLNLGNLIFKESNRFQEVLALLKMFNKSYSSFKNGLEIRGSESLVQGPIDLQVANDHRIVMVGALFLRHHAGGTVSPPQAVSKSWPGFFRLMSS